MEIEIMSLTFETSVLEAFLAEAKITIDKFKIAQEILAEMPYLAREAFDLVPLNNYPAVIENSLNKVIYRVNANFFMGRVKTDLMIPFCADQFYQILHNRLDIEQCQYINSLIENKAEQKEVLAQVLGEDGLNSDQFKNMMRVPAGYNRSNIAGEGFVANLVWITNNVAGRDTDIASMKQSLQYLPKGDSIDFDSGVSVSVALNGNLTIKMNKDLVKTLNNLLGSQVTAA